MKNKNHYFLKYLLFIFSFISLSNCILEIPLKHVIVRKKQKQKYGNISNINQFQYSGNEHLNELSLVEEEVTLDSDLRFLAAIKIGSNNQKFNLLIDTGSYISWVAYKSSKDKKTIKNHYDPSKSNSSYYTGKYFIQKLTTGNCSGYLYTDNLKFINNSNFKLKFGVANETYFNVDGADRIIGLAHYYEDEELSFIHMLKKNKIINSTLFSFKYEEDILEEITGKLIIGKHNDFLSNNTVTCPLIKSSDISNKKYWKCEMTTFGIQYSNRKKDIEKTYNITFDTSSNEIILPIYYLSKLSGETRCSTYHDTYSTRYSCSYGERFDFRIKINNNTFILPKDLFFYKYERGDDDDEYRPYVTYYSKVIFQEDTCIIGMPFFSAFHTLFDRENEMLHFYPENNNVIEKDVKENNSVYKAIIIIGVVGLLIVIISITIIIVCIKRKRAKSNYNLL